MAHDSFSLYSTTDANGNKIGIQIDEMYQFFGIGPGVTNGWYDETGGIDYLLNNGYINMWARNKPEAIGDYRELTDAMRRNNNFGLTAPTGYITLAKYVEAVNNGTLGSWEYNKPRIGTHWFRLSDLDGYNKASPCPFPTIGAGTLILSPQTQLYPKRLIVQLNAGLQGSGNSGGINLSELTMSGADYANYYPGVLLYQSAQKYYIATADSVRGTTVTMDGLALPSAGTYNAYAFISRIPFKQNPSSAGTIIPITTKAAVVKVLESGASVQVSMTIYRASGMVTITAVNYNGNAVTLLPQHIQQQSGGYADPLRGFDSAGFNVPAASNGNPGTASQSYNILMPVASTNLRVEYKYKMGTTTYGTYYSDYVPADAIAPSM